MRFNTLRRSLIAAAAPLALCVLPQPALAAACSSDATSGPNADEIRRLEAIGARSNVDGWSLKEARGFFAPEWVSVQPDGALFHAQDVLSRFVNGRSFGWADRFDLLQLDVRVYCDVAVVVGLAEAHARGAPQSAPSMHFRYTNVWRKVGRRWSNVANQYTRY